MAAREGNTNTVKHNGYGLQKRVQTGLTTKKDYSRFIALLDRWNLSPAEVESMGMLGSAIQAKAWQGLISEDATGAYLFVKENSADLELVTRLGRNAQYQLSKYSRDLLVLHQVLHGDDDSIIDAINSAKGNNGDDSHAD